MESSQFYIKFEGFDADRHMIDMRRLGKSLIGFDRVISEGLIGISEGRLPKQREKFPLVIKAKEPKSGSVEILSQLAPSLSFLPLVQEVFITGGAEVIWRWLSWVFLMAGGRKSAAEPHFQELMKLTRELNESRDKNDEQMREFYLELLDRLPGFAKEAIEPVGPSCDKVTIGPSGGSGSTIIDVATADAVRSKEELVVGEMSSFRVKADGFIIHNRQLKIENPEEGQKYLTAEVRDPIFDSMPNIYSEAAANNAFLDVEAKPTYKNGQLHKLHIMDARPIGEGESD